MKNETNEAKDVCECGALCYPGGWCFVCGKYNPSDKDLADGYFNDGEDE